MSNRLIRATIASLRRGRHAGTTCRRCRAGGRPRPGILRPAVRTLMILALVIPALVIPARLGAEAPPPAAAQLAPGRAVDFRQHFRPALLAELEVVRRTCGSLPKQARPAIMAAAEVALTRLTRHVVDGRRGGPGPDARTEVHAAIAPVLQPLVPADEFAAYEREHAARLARRARTARLRIVEKVADTLDLSAVQTTAIETALQERWQTGWLVELDDNGVIVNGSMLAPDFAAEAITPHLDERQRAAWEAWCREAPATSVHYSRGWQGRSLEPDPWWQP